MPPKAVTKSNVGGSEKINKKQAAKDKLSPADLQDLKDTFDLFDEDHSGTIDPMEIEKVLTTLGLDKRNPMVYQMILDLKDTNKVLGFEEFVEIIVGRLGETKTKEGLQKLFNLYDTDGSGTVDFEKFKAVARELGEALSDDEILEMMHHVHVLNNTDSNEYFTFDDFYLVVTKNTKK